MKSKILPYFWIAFMLFSTMPLHAQNESTIVGKTNYDGLKLRNIGPALTSGRIADIAIHPDDDNVWYVAVGSGGVWKTPNAGTTWKPVFDNQSSYSTGCITIDPNNTNTIWVGTGEDVGGRHMGFGDGVYKSADGGESWTNMGLKESEHIARIIVHPDSSNIIWVAAQGPLWNKGGQRGLYKSTDGGKTWNRTLGDDEWVGVTDVIMDPRDSDVLYAATWQRHRTVAAYMGGGPGTGIYKSTDGGESWKELTEGLPKSNMGKIGLALSPQQPDIIYAAITLDRTTGGVFKSDNAGASWDKMSNTVAGGTGPHYYQELYASPHHFGTIYLMDVRIQVSDDHGRTFRTLQENAKHSDNHAMAFRKDDPDYLMVGSDGGIYQSFDLAENWDFIDNMPIIQIYKLAVDNAKPFYNVYGGTQDNGSIGGPSRTDNDDGIRNADWKKTLFADGYDTATEPGNSDIFYAETQEGGLHRIDKRTGDQVFIQPQAGKGEDYERFNWDAPIEVSPFSPSRLYFASQRVWKSDNRGDSWTPISGDLTRDEKRITQPIMGGQQSWDNPWDVNAMSNYNTITSLAESPKQQGLIYAGTDDGIIQITENDGESWRKVELGSIDGIPDRAFVNDIYADLYDANTVYAALDNHKNGDFSPYLIKSNDRGQSWESIAGNLPDRHLVWRIIQDDEKENLLFAATEFGIFFTIDGGGEWVELSGDVPTIPFRDITIQREQDDLVAASFGRSFFVLDDYTPLRHVDEETLNSEATLFPTRDAYWYVENSAVSSEGADKYKAPNPPFGAVFTYYLKDGYKSMETQRQENEKAIESGEDVPFPGWDQLDAEIREEDPKVQITVKDEAGNVVNRIEGPAGKGFHRVNWELNYPSKDVVELGEEAEEGYFGGGFMATPGTYTASMAKVVRGEVTPLSDPITFEVEPLRDGALERIDNETIVEFRENLEAFQQDLTQTTNRLQKQMDKIGALQTALGRADREAPQLAKRLYETRLQLLELNEKMNGSEAKNEIGERNPPSPRGRLFVGYRALRTTYGPTAMHRQAIEIGKEELAEFKQSLSDIADNVMPRLKQAVEDAGAPPIENN